MMFVMMWHLVLLGEHSVPGTSKITTIHSNQKLTEEESERITKLIKGEVSQVQILFSAFKSGLRCLDILI